MNHRLLSTALAAFLLATAGCTLGPDPERPRTAADEVAAYAHAPAEPEAPSLKGADVAPWWHTFGDPVTEELVAEALEHNTDLRAAAARVLEAQAQLRQSRGTRFPEVSAGVSGTRSKSSFTLPQVGRVAVYSTTYSTNLSAAYQLDLFGKLRRTRQAAWAQALAEEAARETVAHTVISEVVRARVRLSVLGRAVDVAEGVRDSRRETLTTLERRYESGLVSALEVRSARENLATAEADLVSARQQLDQARLALDVLVGRRPGSVESPADLLAPLPELAPVPLGLPADLLDRRPDLRGAEMQLAAATSRVGAAMADLFPGLSLTGSVGSSSDSLSDLVSSDALVYNAVAGLVAPIFNGGQRRAAVEAAEARAEQASAAYAGAVLRALREVEDALVRDRGLRDRLEFLEHRLEEARAADRIARERYERGVTPLLQVLDSERRLRAAENALNAVRGDLWNARIDLHLALGGDWHTDLERTTPATTPATTSAPALTQGTARATPQEDAR